MWRHRGAFPPNQWAAMFDSSRRKVALKISSKDQIITEYILENTYFLTVETHWDSIDARLSQFRNLVKICINLQPMKTFPKSLCTLKHLKSVQLTGCQLRSLPIEIANMKSLSSLNISQNAFTSLPEVLCEIQTLQKLEAVGQIPGLDELPLWLIHSTIKYLNVSSNKISCIPSCYLLIYWMQPELEHTYLRHYERRQCLVLGENRLVLLPQSPNPNNQQHNAARVNNTSLRNYPHFDLLPSHMTLVALAANAYVISLSEEEEKKKKRNVSLLLPSELRELLDNWHECDRCRRRFLFGVRTIRCLEWQGASLRTNFEFRCCSLACATDPRPFGAPAKPRVPKSVLERTKGKVIYNDRDDKSKETTMNSRRSDATSALSLPFDPLTRPRAPLKTKKTKQKKKKEKKTTDTEKTASEELGDHEADVPPEDVNEEGK